MEMIFRPAEPGDKDRICQLLSLLFEQEAEFSPDYAAQARGVDLILQNPDQGMFFVCECDGEVVGTVCMQFLISTALGGKVALLEDFIVEPALRGRGVGHQLLQFSLEHVRQAGCLRVTLLTDGSNERAQHVYRQHGFQASRMLPMRLKF